MDIDKIQIDPNKAKELWYSLFGICIAVEQLGLVDQVNAYIDDNTGLGAHDLARQILGESVISEDETEKNPQTELPVC